MVERAIKYKIYGLIASKWHSSDELAIFKGHEKSGYYQSLEFRIAFLELGIAINESILILIKKVKKWKANLLKKQ